ncbi:lyso-ornithine lipid acyltransferase [Andreprevotia lacus DSM 23236]|jgi:1-acyl-sn-glycerol-3-phosphate acyltransferase|uniref:Lyso-ornithine lipid acyltransferase n=1 Tax=Andreprevotia lacus DSM 23236 TaxID=1121001 RepID=A0A1W1WVW8_9NEIS|nr:lysophospholipid acyltransferase family protein [Andreprevotia lacus]SMC15869.1 lyso-ornithine lipid acyltransferase [Andreprevotia lacus DSM 23236]
MGAVAWIFPRYSQPQRVAHIQRWSAKLTRILGIHVRVQGLAPGVYPANHLLISNHISWLDIFVLNAVTVSRFVAKSEIRSWPIIGKLCCGTGTLFIERAKKRDTARVGQDMLSALQAGHCLAVFPEGTTSDGGRILPFRSSLLQAAVEGNTTLQPIYLRYCNTSGQRCALAAYIDDVSFGQSLWRILGNRGLTVEINFLSPIASNQVEDRRSLTRTVEARIQAAHNALEHHAQREAA